jgi:hypothetical protein
MYVADLVASLQAQNRDRFAPGPFSPANLDWKALLICAVVEAAIVAGVRFESPPSDPILTASVFAYSFLFGMALMLFTRVKGVWQRLLLMAPAVLVMLFSEVTLGVGTGTYFFGWIFGLVLMGAGLAGEGARAIRRRLTQA